MSTEYGLFSDEGLVESGFYSIEEAETVRRDRYSVDDGLVVDAVCPEHPDHGLSDCEECADDEDNEEAEDDDDWIYPTKY